MSLAVLAEGCAEPMIQNLQQLVSIVLHGFQDQSTDVRSAAVLCVAQFAQNLRPDFLQFSDQVIPLLLEHLNDPSESVRVRVLGALEACIDELAPHQLEPQLDVIVTRLLQLLTQGAPGTSVCVCVCVSGREAAEHPES